MHYFDVYISDDVKTVDPECASRGGHNTVLKIETEISISLTESKDGITLINSFYFEFRSVNLPKHKPNIKGTIKSICREAFSQMFAQKIIIKASTLELISNKFLCFQEQQTMIAVVSQSGLIRRIL